MVDNDDKYAEDEENLTQVRSIIKQLNEDTPAQERARQVVVRADGSKMVRVTKKRRVMLTTADLRRKTRMHILWGVVASIIIAAACGAYFFFRMAAMSSAVYLEEQRFALQKAWNATEVRLEGAGIEGTSLKLNSIVAEFPEDCILQRVELDGISADLDVASFLTGRIKGESVGLDRALLVLRNGASMQMPKQQGRDLWWFRRMECKNLSVQFAEAEGAPLQVRNAQAYVYYPDRQHDASVLMLREGTLHINGWKVVRMYEAKMHLSQQGITDFSVRGTTDAVSDEVEQRRTSIAFAGKLENGSAWTGPYAVEADNMLLADFTDGRFEEMFTARTVAVSHGKLSGKATITLAEGQGMPAFEGEFHLKGLSLSSFPALMAIQEHIEPSKRRLYNPLSLHRGRVRLVRNGGVYGLEMPERAVEERDLATLSGKLELNEKNELSGELNYGIPTVLARVEYPDGHPDPIFQQNGEWAVLRTRLKGLGNMPGDDMAEVEARASIARRNRPERIPFEKLDINVLTNQLLDSPATPAPADTAAPGQAAEPAFTNPFEVKEEPYAPASPF